MDLTAAHGHHSLLRTGVQKAKRIDSHYSGVYVPMKWRS